MSAVASEIRRRGVRAALILALLAGVLIGRDAVAQEAPVIGDRAPPTLQSTGSCSILIDPDRARIAFAVAATNADPAVAIASAEARTAELRTAVETLGLPDLQLAVSTPQTVADAAYHVEFILTAITSDFRRMGEAAAVGRSFRGVSLVDFVRYVSDDRRRAAEGDCLSIAIGNAQARAQRIADTLGVALGAPLNVVDATPPVPGPNAIGQGKLPDVQTMPGEAAADRLRVELTIVVDFAIE